MSRTRYFTFLMVIIAGFVVVQSRIGQSQYPSKASLEDLIAQINHESQSHAIVAIIMLVSILILSVAYHLSNRQKPPIY